MLLVCIALFIFAPFLARQVVGWTNIAVVAGGGKLYAQVDDTRLDFPADQLDAALLARVSASSVVPELAVDPAATSVVDWQPAQPGPFNWLGVLGEQLQQVIPVVRWLPTTPGGNVLSGGRGTGRISLVAPGGSGYALVVRPERRDAGWWRVEGGKAVEQVTGSKYRPAGLSALGDVVAELLVVFWAAAGVVLLCWLVGFVFALFNRRAEANNDISQENEVPQSPHPPLIRSRTERFLPMAFMFALVILSSVICISVLDGIPHVQDEVGYLFQGRIFALFRSWVPAPPGPEFFQHSFIQIYEGRWFSKYPPGYPLLLAPGLWADIPWLINPLCAGASLALVYATGRSMYGRHVAVWAALVGLVSPWVLFMSASYMSHASTMLWAALFLFALVRLRISVANRNARGRLGLFDSSGGWAILAGFAIGMAFATREWTAFGIGLGGAVWVAGELVFSRGVRLQKLIRYGFVLVGFLPPLLFLLYENKQLTGDWLVFAQNLVGSYDTPGFGPGHGDAVGHTPALGVHNALVYLRSLGAVFDGWPAPLSLAPLALALIGSLTHRARRLLAWDGLLWLSWAGLVGAYFLWWSSTTIYGPRYWYEGMPFLLLLAGRGMDFLGYLASHAAHSPAAQQVARWAVPGLIFAILTVYNLSQSLPYQVSAYTNYNDITPTALANAEAAHLQDTLVFVALEPSRSNRDYGKVFFANDPLLNGNVVYARDLGAVRNRGLSGYFPGRRPYWLPLDGPPQPGFGP